MNEKLPKINNIAQNEWNIAQDNWNTHNCNIQNEWNIAQNDI
jgi:hypothetical protein